MLRGLFVLGFFFVFSNSAMASIDSQYDRALAQLTRGTARVQEGLDKYRAQSGTAEARFREAFQTYEDLKAARKELEERINEERRASDARLGKPFVPFRRKPPELAEFDKKIEAAKKEWDRQRKEINKLRGDIYKLQQTEKKLDEQMIKLRAEREKQHEKADKKRQESVDRELRGLQAKIEKAGMTERFDDIKIEHLEQKVVLDELVSQYDSALIGQYVNEKINRAFESQNFCSKVRSCSGGDGSNGSGSSGSR